MVHKGLPCDVVDFFNGIFGSIPWKGTSCLEAIPKGDFSGILWEKLLNHVSLIEEW